MTDYEIYKNYKMKPILNIAKKLGLKRKNLEFYGEYKAKINLNNINTDRKGKLILVTSINPTSSGEGKTFGLVPSCVVIVAAIKAIKLNGGLSNLERHLQNLKNYGLNIVCTLNNFHTDAVEEINEVRKLCESRNIPFEVSAAFSYGAKGCRNLAELVVKECEKPVKLQFTYNDEDTVKEKIEKVAKKYTGQNR